MQEARLYVRFLGGIAFVLALSVLAAACIGGGDGTASTESVVGQVTPAPTAVVPTPTSRAAPTVVVETVTPDPTSAAPVEANGSDLAPADTAVYWRGTIDGTIGYTMWLAQSDGYVLGELTYDSSGVPIRLAGRRYEQAPDSYYIREFSPDGQVTGLITITGVLDGAVTDAQWSNLRSGDLAMTMEPAGQVGEFVFEPNLRPGIYRYAFAPFGGNSDEECCGPAASLTISAATADTLTVAMNAVTSGPAFNIADVPEIALPLSGNRATFDAVEGDFIDCKFDITVFDGVAFVDYVDDRFDCGWGHNASVVGIYVLTTLS